MERSTSKIIEDYLEHHKENISAQDYRFYQLEKIINITKILEKNKNCTECQKKLHQLEQHIIKLPDTLDNKEKRVIFNETSQKATKHLRKKHGYYLSHFFTYTYSFIGMLAGLIVGTIIILLAPNYSRIFIMLVTWFAGLIAGRIIGTLKDKKIKKTDYQL